MPKKTTTATHAAIGHNSLDPTRLRSFVDRVSTLENEIADLSEDRKSVYAEAKDSGVDPKALKEIVRVTRMEADKREEWAARMETISEYLASLGDLNGTPLGDSAVARAFAPAV
jgi:uncharacterized protein (UPF0335 family)